MPESSRFGSIPHLQLRHDVGDVSGHRADRDKECIRDFLIATTFRQLLQNLRLPFGDGQIVDHVEPVQSRPKVFGGLEVSYVASDHGTQGEDLNLLLKREIGHFRLKLVGHNLLGLLSEASLEKLLGTTYEGGGAKRR